MAISRYGTALSFNSVRFDRQANGDLLIYDYVANGGTLYRDRAGTLSTVATGLGGFGAVTALSDGAALLYRQDFEAGGVSFAVVGADGGLRVPFTSAATDGDGQGGTQAIRGPSATATVGGGFFLGVTDTTYGTQQTTVTFPPSVDLGITSAQIPRTYDVSHRFYGADGTARGRSRSTTSGATPTAAPRPTIPAGARPSPTP